MAKKNKLMDEAPQKQSQNEDPNHPYFGDLRGYLDLRDQERARTSMWRNIAFIELFLLALSISGLIYIAIQSKFVPMVFYTDSNGAMTYGGVANQKLRITQPMIANLLKTYIIALRQLPTDMDLKNEYLRQVKMMSTPDLFQNIVVPMITERYKSNSGLSIKVSITNIFPIGKGGSTWEIDWTESINSKIVGTYKGSISFSLDPSIKDPGILLYDPLGMVVTDINIGPEVK